MAWDWNMQPSPTTLKFDEPRFRRNMIGGQPTNMQLLAQQGALKGIDRFRNRNFFGSSATAAGDSPLSLTREQGITQSQEMNPISENSIVTSTQRQEQARGMQAQLEKATEAKAREYGTREMVGDVFGGLQLGASMASMMMDKDRDFGAKTKRFFEEAMANPLTEKYVSRGIDAIIGGIGGEATEGMKDPYVGTAADPEFQLTARGTPHTEEALGIGEGPLDAAGGTEEALSEVGEQLSQEVSEEVVTGATEEITAEAAGEAAEEATEATAEAGLGAAPVVGGIMRMGAGLLGGKGVGEAALTAGASTVAGVLASMNPIGYITGPLAAAGTSIGMSAAMAGGAPGGAGGMRSSLARKTMKVPKAKDILTGRFGYG